MAAIIPGLPEMCVNVDHSTEGYLYFEYPEIIRRSSGKGVFSRSTVLMFKFVLLTEIHPLKYSHLSFKIYININLFF